MVAGLFEESRVYNIDATAIDKTPNSHFVVAAGYHNAYIFNTTSLESFQEVKIKSKFISRLVCHPRTTSQVAIVSGSDVGIYTLDTGHQKVRWKLTSGSSKYISDISWNHFNNYLIATCANYDMTIIRDLRVPRKVAIELGSCCGASHVQYAPMMENILATSNFDHVSLWDQRQSRAALTEFEAHDSMITCLKWHPNNKHSFLTSSKDGLLRCWDFFDEEGKRVEQPDVHERDLDCWRFWFAPDGEEYAVIKSPLSENHEGHLAVYQYPFQENLNPLKIDTSDLFIDLCWDKNPGKPSKFVWALRQNKGLIRHAILFDYSSENREEMATPIAQSAMDEESDRLVAFENRQEILVDKGGIGYSSSSEYGSPDKGGNIIGHMDIDTTDKQQQSSQYGQHFSPSNSWNEKEQSPIRMSPSANSMKSFLAQIYLTRQTSSSVIPISPLPGGTMDYEKWITAPNVTGGDLLAELDALWLIDADGITMTEINIPRAAIGFVYEHFPIYRKLSFEVRYHRAFVENGKIVVKLLQNNCPLNKDQAYKLLNMMQLESERQFKIHNRNEPIFSRVLKEMKNIITSMKVFTADGTSPSTSSYPSITPPTPSTMIPTILNHHNQYHFPSIHGVSDERKRPTSTSSIIDETESEGSESSLRQSISLSFVLTHLDEYVPAPRTSGAQFDSSGYLVRFGNFRSTIRHGFRGESGGSNNKLNVNGGINFKELGIIDVDNEGGDGDVSSDESQTGGTLFSLIRGKKKEDNSSVSSLSSASSTKSDDKDDSEDEKNSSSSETGNKKIEKELKADEKKDEMDTDGEIEEDGDEEGSGTDSFITATPKSYDTSSSSDSSSESTSYETESEESENRKPEIIPEEKVALKHFEIGFDDVPEDPIQAKTSLPSSSSSSPSPSFNQEFDIGEFPLHSPDSSENEAHKTTVISMNTLKERDIRKYGFDNDELDVSQQYRRQSQSPIDIYKSSPSASSYSSDEQEEMTELRKRKRKKSLTSVLLAAPKATMFPFGDVKAAPKSLVDYLDLMGPILREIAQHKRDAVNAANNPEEGYSPDGYPKGDNVPYHCVSPVRTFSLSSSPTAASIILHRNNPRGRLSSSPGSNRSFSSRHRGGSLTLTDPDSNIKSSSSDFLVSTPVELFDVSYYLPVSKEMAKSYRLLGGSHKKLIKHNIKQVRSQTRTDVVQTWDVCQEYVKSLRRTFIRRPLPHCSKKYCETFWWDWNRKYDTKEEKNERIQKILQLVNVNKYKTSWSDGTLNANFFKSLLQSHLDQGDVQTVAAITCALADVCRLPPKKRPKNARSNAWGAIIDPEKIENGIIRSASETNNLSGSPLINVMWPPNNEKSKRSASIGGSASEEVAKFLARREKLALILGPLADRNTIHGGLVSNTSNDGRKASKEEDNNFQMLQRLALRHRARSNSIGDSNDANIFPTEPIFDDDEDNTPVQTDAPDESTLEEMEKIEDHVMIFESKSDDEIDEDPIDLNSVKTEYPIVTGPAFDHFETARISYAEILARWGMFKKSAEVLKFCPSQQPDPFSLLIACSMCQQVFESEEVADVCNECQKELIICVICDFPCNGLIMTCPLCSHGGHTEHMRKWFKEQSICPMGGCACLCPL